MIDFIHSQTTILWPLILLAFVGGYLSGSVPYGLILTRLAGMGDIRTMGSGNIGATNVLRVGGKKIAILTLLLDALKGAVPVLVAKQIHMDYAVLAALGAFLGHLFPMWLNFKGGKGVATGIGICFGFSLFLGLDVVLIWLATALAFRYSSLSALAAFLFAPLIAWFLLHDSAVTCTVAFISILLWIRHHENINRLINKTEGKINLKKSA